MIKNIEKGIPKPSNQYATIHFLFTRIRQDNQRSEEGRGADHGLHEPKPQQPGAALQGGGIERLPRPKQNWPNLPL